jgi:CheY-like chemotaxis protein
MPIMTGLELIKKLRTAEKNKELKLKDCLLIAHTAMPKESLGDYKELGFNYYMEKPL